LADLDHGLGIAFGEREISLDASSPFDEKAYRVCVDKVVNVIARLAGGERWQSNQLLTVDGHAFSAGGQHHHPGAGMFDAADEVSHRAQQVLAIVQHQQKLFLRKNLDEAVLE
jgi:hypothetical protein